MKTPDDAVEQWLRSTPPLPEIPDDGFSARVVTAAYQHRQSTINWTRWGACVLGAIAGIGLAVGNGATVADVSTASENFGRAFAGDFSRLANPTLLFAITATLASIGIAYLPKAIFARMRK